MLGSLEKIPIKNNQRGMYKFQRFIAYRLSNYYDNAKSTSQYRSTAPTRKSPTTETCALFLGDGMGITTLTASRIYVVGEDGQLAIDQLPESAFVRTFSEDAQVTDSAP